MCMSVGSVVRVSEGVLRCQQHWSIHRVELEVDESLNLWVGNQTCLLQQQYVVLITVLSPQPLLKHFTEKVY